MSTAVDRVIATAKAEVGYLEKKSNANLDSFSANAGYNNYTKYARDLDATGLYNFPKQGYSWCDIFVDWCFVKTFGLNAALKMQGQSMHGVGAGCTESASYYKSIGRFYRSPQPGDQIFFSSNSGKTMYHTGLVYKVDNNYVYTIEGNTSNASGVVSNGGGVAQKSYRKDYWQIGGYGRPRWEYATGASNTVKSTPATSTNTQQEEDDDMDVKRFTELYTEMRKGLQDNDANTYSEEARNYFVNNGLIAGSNGPDGKPNYMWQDVLTREQFVTILYRVIKKLEEK